MKKKSKLDKELDKIVKKRKKEKGVPFGLKKYVLNLYKKFVKTSTLYKIIIITVVLYFMIVILQAIRYGKIPQL
ncbi:hypothetical protein M2454_001453 [Aequitasia blattaphilus]|uniref:Preprotein translocase subunit SecE n=1 Tax=Aequitasia blattaphilus TaxID=2949332 RepID=A0ABT1E7M8_9FIRM|nr:hypothetical protein [Aequitasia blattaphilus]MCP1101711.1 hypothetical protein [Aequitasia blattaphilus]MCR8614351.1 hypothetical protein [Aequitasia blattaphilus]